VLTVRTDLLNRLRGVRVLVLGDVMLDRFVYGSAKRLSPEAPIPVLSVERETAMVGGAGNVALNVGSLGGKAVLIGVIGDDAAGEEVTRLVAAAGGITDALVRSRSRPTTEKTRFIAERQQILRADRELCDPIGDAGTQLLDTVRKHLHGVDAVIVSDYAKGVVGDTVIRDVVAAARLAGKPLVVDPKSRDFRRYDGASVLTPNWTEAATSTGIAEEDDASVAKAGLQILAEAPQVGAVLITRGPRGMSLVPRGSDILHIPAAPLEVFDVSGAGDTVVATLALGLGAGAALADAAELANVAAGVAVAKAGTAAVSAEEVAGALQSREIHSVEAKILSPQTALERIRKWRARGERIGFTNGCFDLIHPGHVSLLAKARAHCDRLIVGLNTDSSVRRLKGESRPVQDETARAVVLASLFSVDLVVLFDEETPEDLIESLRPDVLVKGADYTRKEVVGADFVESYGGKVVLVDIVAGQSTSRMIARAAGA